MEAGLTSTVWRCHATAAPHPNRPAPAPLPPPTPPTPTHTRKRIPPQVPAHSWSHESLNHLLQLESHLLELRPGRRVLRLCYGHAGGLPLRDRAW